MAIKVLPDLTGFAPADSQWMAYDDSTYDGAPDAGPQVVGFGPTAAAALADYADQAP